MNLVEMLPNLKGWRFDIQLPIQYVIPAGQFVTTFHSATIKKPMKGYLLGTGVVSDNPLLQAEAVHWGPKWQERTIVATSFALNAAGLTGYWNPSGYASIYNAVLGIYSIAYQPDAKTGSFDQELRLRLINPTAVPVTVASYSHTLVLVVNDKDWRESIHKFFQSNVFKVKIPEEEPEEKPKEKKA